MGSTKRANRPGRRQFFQPGELPLILLELLRARARHGYELMSELDRLFGPEYRASAGSVYPALTALLEEGLILEERDHGGPRRRYRCSATGRAALAKRRAALAAIEVRTGVRLRTERELAAVIDRFAARVDQLGGAVDPDEVEAMLDNVATRLETAARRGKPNNERR